MRKKRRPLITRFAQAPSRSTPALVLVGTLLCLAAGLDSGDPAPAAAQQPQQVQTAANIDEMLTVDCRLPGQIRRLGRQATFMTSRRAGKGPARDRQRRRAEYPAPVRADYKTAL